MNIQSQLRRLEPGADILGRSNDGSGQRGTDLNGVREVLAVGQTDGNTCAESIACAGGINKAAGKAGAMSFLTGYAVIENGAVLTHGNYH